MPATHEQSETQVTLSNTSDQSRHMLLRLQHLNFTCFHTPSSAWVATFPGSQEALSHCESQTHHSPFSESSRTMVPCCSQRALAHAHGQLHWLFRAVLSLTIEEALCMEACCRLRQRGKVMMFAFSATPMALNVACEGGKDCHLSNPTACI